MTAPWRRRGLRLVGLAFAMAVAACGPSAGVPASGEGALWVSAASSLADAFAQVESAFEQQHPTVDVMLNLAASSLLREQILSGAPIDVFASADPSHVSRIIAAGQVDAEPRRFARNALRIAVPAGNPAGVTGLSDFSRESLRIGLCAPTVPCGDLARRALARAGVVPSLDTLEPNVRSLRTKVEAGELDAAIVYATDVSSSAGRVEGVDSPEVDGVMAEYVVAVLARTPHPRTAAAFVSFLLAEEGQRILRRHGFAPS